MTELDAILSKMNKSMKVGSIKVGVEYEDVPKLPFSSMRLNYMTYGGIPLGRIVEFAGGEGGGKTTTALDLAAQAQKLYPDKKVVFCDIEHTFDTVWATKLGVDIDSLVYFDPDTMGAEEVFQYALDIMDTGEVSLFIMDSLGAMVSDLENEKEVGERTYGGISMALTTFSKKAIPVCQRTKCIFLAINQIREDMNSTYGGTRTVGGRAWRHNCSTRLSFRLGEYIDDKGGKLTRGCENPAGNLVYVNLVKTKVCPPDRKVGFYTLNYMDGIDFISDTLDLAIKYDVVHQAGAFYSIVDISTGEILTNGEETLKFQGKAKILDYLRAHSDIYEWVVAQVEKAVN